MSTLALAERIAATLLPLLAIVALGALYGRWWQPDFRGANRANMDIFLPALLFSVLVAGDFRVWDMLPLVAWTALIVLAGGAVAAAIAALSGWPLQLLAPALMFRNAGNIGLPLAVFAFGEAALPAATMVFLCSNLLHFSLGARLLSGDTDAVALLRPPMVWVSLLALALNLGDITPPALLMRPVAMLGEVSIPLMLFALGMRLQGGGGGDWRPALAIGLLCPVVGLLLYLAISPWLALPPLQHAALLAYAVMPPAVLNYLFAERYDRYPAAAASAIALAHAVALVSLPLLLAWSLLRVAPPG